MAVNLTSAFHTATEAAASMREQGYGRIVFFSSVAGRSGHKLHGPYAATKGAINQLMRVIAHEYAEHGVTANAVAPGLHGHRADPAVTSRRTRTSAQALVELIPAGRFGTLRRGGRPGAVPELAARELHHRAGSVHRRRSHDRLRSEWHAAQIRGPGASWSPERAPASAPRSPMRAAQEGARPVLVHYRSSADGAERTAERVRAHGAEAALVQGDITSWADIKRMAELAFGEHGGVDVLVNNVGDMASGQASWTEVTEEAIDHVLAVDIKGTMLMVHEFGQRMVQRGGGAIVNVGSTVIVRGSPRAPQYAAGKYGLLGVTKSYAKALAPDRPRQHLRARVHGDRGAAGPSGVAGRPARGRAVAGPRPARSRPGGHDRRGAVPGQRRCPPHHRLLHDRRRRLQHAREHEQMSPQENGQNTEDVYERVRGAILDGELAPGR